MPMIIRDVLLAQLLDGDSNTHKLLIDLLIEAQNFFQQRNDYFQLSKFDHCPIDKDTLAYVSSVLSIKYSIKKDGLRRKYKRTDISEQQLLDEIKEIKKDNQQKRLRKKLPEEIFEKVYFLP